MRQTRADGGRSDARRNRERILVAAREAFDASSEPTMQSVAVAAGVGQGTLYRHFPTKEALLAEIYRDDFEALLSAGPALIAEAGGSRALRLWLDELASLGRMKHAITGVLDAATRAELHDAQRQPLLDAIEVLLAAARDAGGARGDVTAEDLLALVSFLWHIDLDEQRTLRLLDVVTDGLRPQPGQADEARAAAQATAHSPCG